MKNTKSVARYKIFNCFTMEVYRIVTIISVDMIDRALQLGVIRDQYKDSGYQLFEGE